MNKVVPESIRQLLCDHHKYVCISTSGLNETHVVSSVSERKPIIISTTARTNVTIYLSQLSKRLQSVHYRVKSSPLKFQ